MFLRHLSSQRAWLTTALVCAFAAPAQAHVKWFCAFDVAGQPRGLENVLCLDFELLVGFAFISIAMGCLVEGTSVGAYLTRILDRATAWPRLETDVMIRAVAGAFFIALWALGGILLTPELKTDSTWISVLQLGIAAAMLWRPALPLAALGIVYLFTTSIAAYGWFHLMDYPIFLGLAAYLALTGLRRSLFGLRPLDIFRFATAITLMWASIEKWAYPEWTFPLFIIHPDMTMGFNDEFFMRAAGAIEFALAFCLLWTPLVRRIGALLLLGMFVSAVAAFGKVDAIGHSVIIAILIGIICDDVRCEAPLRQFRLLPVAYPALLTLFIAAYYGLHVLSFGAPA